MAHLDDELPNFRAVLSGAVSQPQLDIALRIACALTDYWYLRDLDQKQEHGWRQRSRNLRRTERSGRGPCTRSVSAHA